MPLHETVPHAAVSIAHVPFPQVATVLPAAAQSS
jgi:hypothetical protein